MDGICENTQRYLVGLLVYFVLQNHEGKIKGALPSFGEDIDTQRLNIYNINEVKKQTFCYQLFSEEIRSPGNCLRLER